MRKSIVALLFVVLSVVCFQGVFQQSVVAQASTEEKITLSPAVETITLAAGGSRTGKMTVINDGQTAYTFKVYAAPFSVKGEDYQPDFITVNERTQAFQWVTFAKNTHQLQAGERIAIDYKINTPKNAAGGGHYAVLFAETQPPEDGANVARKKRVGTLLYMSLDGTTEKSGFIDSFSTNFWQKKAPVESNLRIKNDGNVHFQANIDFYYQNLFNRKVFQLKKESLILPGTTRRVPIAWEQAPYFGIFKTGGTVAFLDKTETIPTRYILLLPYQLLVIVFVAIVLITILLLLKKRSNRRGVRFVGKSSKRR